MKISFDQLKMKSSFDTFSFLLQAFDIANDILKERIKLADTVTIIFCSFCILVVIFRYWLSCQVIISAVVC